ncbi:5'-nucleotidase-like protein [Archangium gephyra]|uniref:5'-nucleotidase-like protein n=1 Tax=Archangium gephyra TaxID=48 RepID=A0AAC8Q7L8_9BACT|nr:5'-nucleotidase [Archangium gephyra]AKJ02420.1 Alkaline phosphatase [Archangium gephyra]REG28655.1 5'-nucleotidase-like protein [Archangium gephyra]
MPPSKKRLVPLAGALAALALFAGCDTPETPDGTLFGKTQVFLNGSRASVRTEETNLGDLTADAYLWFARKTDPSTVLSFRNSGGIRESIDTGEISQADIEKSLPFNNALVLVTVTAAQLEQVLEHGVAAVAPEVTAGQFPQVSGLRFEYDASKPAQVFDLDGNLLTEGERIRQAVLVDGSGNVLDTLVSNGALVGDPHRTFRMVTLDFVVAFGGDYYPFPLFELQDAARYHLVPLDTTPDNQGFNDAGREQKAFADYLAATWPTSGPGYAEADTPKEADTRIKSVGP